MLKMLLWVVLNFLLAVLLKHCSAVGHFQNAALDKPCAQSSAFGLNPHECGAAINGNTSGVSFPGPNCILTEISIRGFPYDSYDWNPWWQVDLGRSYPIHNIVVWGRTDGDTITRMSGCQIRVDGDLCYTFGTVPETHTQRFDITCNPPRSGQVIRVEKNTSSSIEGGWNHTYSINMCEFEVFVCSDGYWGRGCDRPCDDGYWGTGCGIPCESCPDNQTCDKETGICPVNGQWGLWGSWGTCSVTCGGGSQSRSRQCDHPTPASKGSDCPGNDTETIPCNTAACQSAFPVAAIVGAAVGGVVVTAAIAAVIVLVFVRRRGRDTHDASGTNGARHAHGKTSSATSPEGGTTTDDNYYVDVSGLEPTRESHRRTKPDSAATDTSSATATTTGATVYQNVGEDTAANYERLDVSTFGQTSVYTKLKKSEK